MKNRGFIFFIFTILVGVVVIFIANYFIFGKSSVVWKKTPSTTATSTAFVSPLDGLPVANADQAAVQVVGVMIDNHPDARPQSGLNKARIVYEAPAEGGITRYFAIFNSKDEVAKVGPVRSARPYFIDWLEEYGGMYMHCGGSPDGLAKIKADKVFDFDEMKNGQYFWRDSSRTAPHNLYTSSKMWNQGLDKNISRQNKFSASWKFGDLAQTNLQASSVSVPYVDGYEVTWQYNQSDKVYYRSINEASSTSDGADIYTDNVIMQFAKMATIDDYGRREIYTDNGGEARLLRDGMSFVGSWKKVSGRTIFYDSSGQEMVLKPGKTWIEVVPSDLIIKISA